MNTLECYVGKFRSTGDVHYSVYCCALEHSDAFNYKGIGEIVDNISSKQTQWKFEKVSFRRTKSNTFEPELKLIDGKELEVLVSESRRKMPSIQIEIYPSVWVVAKKDGQYFFKPE